MWHRFAKGTTQRDQPTPHRKPRERFRDLPNEAEAFLGGRYAEHLLGRQQPVPDWAWLNMLAHGPLSSIETLARQEPPRPAWWCHRGETRPNAEEVAAWRMALHYLAREMLRRWQVEGRDVEDLQHDVLIGLELSMAQHDEVPGSPPTGHLGPAQLIVTVLSLFDQTARSSS